MRRGLDTVRGMTTNPTDPEQPARRTIEDFLGKTITVDPRGKILAVDGEPTEHAAPAAPPPRARSIIDLVRGLQPGYARTFSANVLEREVQPNPGWTPAEWVLESIMGSAFEYRIYQDPMTRNVTFSRLKEPLPDGLRTYVSPDRRHHFEFDGSLYRPKPLRMP